MKTMVIITLLISSFVYADIDIDRIRPSVYSRYFVYEHSSQKVEELGEWDRVSEIIFAGDIAVFRAQQGDRFCYVNARTGEIIGDTYKFINMPFEVDGTYLFHAANEDKQFLIDFRTGEKIVKEYDNIGVVSEFGGRTLARIMDNDRIFYVELPSGEVASDKFDLTGEPLEYGNTVYIPVLSDDKWKWIDLFTNEIIGGVFDNIGKLDTLPDMIYFPAQKDGKWMRVNLETGEILPGRYDQIQYPYIYGENWATVVVVDDKQWLIASHNGELIGDGYEEIITVVHYSGHWLVNIAEGDEPKWINIAPDGALQERFLFIDDTTSYKGEHYFLAVNEFDDASDRLKSSWHRLRDNKQIGRGFNEIFAPQKVRDNLYFRANKNGLWAFYDFETAEAVTNELNYVGQMLIETDHGVIFSAMDDKGAFWGVLNSEHTLPEGKRYDSVCCYESKTSSFIATSGKKRTRIDLQSGTEIEKLGN